MTDLVRDLAACEALIERGPATFVEVVDALPELNVPPAGNRHKPTPTDIGIAPADKTNGDPKVAVQSGARTHRPTGKGGTA